MILQRSWAETVRNSAAFRSCDKLITQYCTSSADSVNRHCRALNLKLAHLQYMLTIFLFRTTLLWILVCCAFARIPYCIEDASSPIPLTTRCWLITVMYTDTRLIIHHWLAFVPLFKEMFYVSIAVMWHVCYGSETRACCALSIKVILSQTIPRLHFRRTLVANARSSSIGYVLISMATCFSYCLSVLSLYLLLPLYRLMYKLSKGDLQPAHKMWDSLF